MDTICERDIRTQLAKNLHLIDSSLVLVEEEFKLINNFGTNGSVDILAKDRAGMFVVIELKRNNTSARQALHELHKYVALLKTQFGLAKGAIRCILISLEWEELLTPFSEFKRASEYSVDGFELKIDSLDGRMELRLSPICAILTENPLIPARQAYAYLFAEREKRDEAAHYIEEAYVTAGIESLFAVRIDRESDDGRVAHSFCLYLVLIGPSEGVRNDLILRHKLTEENLSDVSGEITDAVAYIVHEDLCRADIHDSMEIGYPEKFASILSSGWKVGQIDRFGMALSNKAIYSDNDLIVMARGDRSGNGQMWSSIANPIHKDAWSAFINSASECLEGNDEFLSAFAYACGVAERMEKSVTVSAQMYNPMNLSVTIFKMVARDDERFNPRFEILIDSIEDEPLIYIRGELASLGPLPQDKYEILGRVFGDVDTMIMALGLGMSYEYDTELIEQHRLQYVFVESRLDKDVPTVRLLTSNAGNLIPAAPGISYLTLHDGMQADIDYYREYVRVMNEVCSGL